MVYPRISGYLETGVWRFTIKTFSRLAHRRSSRQIPNTAQQQFYHDRWTCLFEHCWRGAFQIEVASYIYERASLPPLPVVRTNWPLPARVILMTVVNAPGSHHANVFVSINHVGLLRSVTPDWLQRSLPCVSCVVYLALMNLSPRRIPRT